MQLGIKHSANAGDIIYTLWAAKKLSLIYDKPVDYYQRLDVPAQYYEGAEHPTLDKSGKMVSFNRAMFDLMKPLIEALPFINSFSAWKGERGINFDRIREINMNQAFTDIRRWYSFVYPELTYDYSLPVINGLDILPKSIKVSERRKYEITKDAIVVNKTSRYGNQNITYDFLNHVESDVYFVGTLDECYKFQNIVTKAKYIAVDNFLELARYMYNAKLFIGNQSFCFSLAEAMKTPRILEVCPFCPNVSPVGPNGYEAYLQQGFEDLVAGLSA
jgi:hypothetical protein